MFTGEYPCLMSDRRVTIPTEFKQELEEEVVIAKNPDGCLFLCSPKEREQLPLEVKSKIDIRRRFPGRIFSQAIMRKIDRWGRIEIPDDLQKYANLQKEIVFVGCGDYIEIWDKERWENEVRVAGIEVESF